MAKKEIGGRSAQQNDFVPPLAPIISSAADIGTNRPFNDGAISVTFSLPTESLPATSYTVTAIASGQTTRTATGSSSPISVVGLASNVAYSVSMTATNVNGTSSATSPIIVTATTVPAAPNAPSVSTQVNQDNLSWNIPANGGKAISSYGWESNDAKSGTTANTSVSVAQEGGTTQAYRVRALNANGWGAWSPYSGNVTTTPPFFPFFPYFPPYFPPFFPFFPWFPFFPYFPPWFPYFPPYFPPFFPRFSPLCIAADTMIHTKDGLVAAKDLAVGQKVTSFIIDEMSIDEEHEMFSWNSDSFTLDEEYVEAEVVTVIEKVNNIVYFNGDKTARYSTTQPLFVKVDDSYSVRTTGSIDIGTILIKPNFDGTYEEVEITEITLEDEVDVTYQINCEPYDWFVAGGYLVHNK
jgi:PKD repeat protein